MYLTYSALLSKCTVRSAFCITCWTAFKLILATYMYVAVVHPDLELRWQGVVLFCLSSQLFLPSVISSVFAQNKGGLDPSPTSATVQVI